MAMLYQRVCLRVVVPLLLVLSCLSVPTTSYAVVHQKQPGSRPSTTRYYFYQNPSQQRNNENGQYVKGLHAYVAGEPNKPGFIKNPSHGPSYGQRTQGYPQYRPQEKYVQNPSHRTTQSQGQTPTHDQFQPAPQQGSTKNVELATHQNTRPITNQHKPNNHGSGSHTHGGPLLNAGQLFDPSKGNIYIPNINGAGATIHLPQRQETSRTIYFPNQHRKNVHVHFGRVTHGAGSGHLGLPNEQRSRGHTHKLNNPGPGHISIPNEQQSDHIPSPSNFGSGHIHLPTEQGSEHIHVPIDSGSGHIHLPEFDLNFDTIQTEHGHIHVPKTQGNKPNLSFLPPELKDQFNPTSQHTPNNQEGILPHPHMTSGEHQKFTTPQTTNNSPDDRTPTHTSDTAPKTLIPPTHTTDQGSVIPSEIGDEALLALLLDDAYPKETGQGVQAGGGSQDGGTSVKTGDEQGTREGSLLGIVNLRTKE